MLEANPKYSLLMTQKVTDEANNKLIIKYKKILPDTSK